VRFPGPSRLPRSAALLALGASRERRDLAADYPRELYDFDWDATFPTAPYARIDAGTMLAFKRP